MRKRLFAALLASCCVVPFLYILVRSLIGMDGTFTLDYFYQVFLAQSQYLLRFWKSMALSLCIAAGQLLVSVFAGYGFSKCRFPGRDVLFFLLIFWMVVPLQVTLVPNYLTLDELGLLDTYYALALPMIFVPLGTFIMTQAFRAIPNEICEAAGLDGSSVVGTLFRVMVPMSRSALICVAVLSFLDGWNMVEQPIVFLREFSQYPLAVALASVPPGDPNVQLVCCLLAALPLLMIFAVFGREMAVGIELGGGKSV